MWKIISTQNYENSSENLTKSFNFILKNNSDPLISQSCIKSYKQHNKDLKKNQIVNHGFLINVIVKSFVNEGVENKMLEFAMFKDISNDNEK